MPNNDVTTRAWKLREIEAAVVQLRQEGKTVEKIEDALKRIGIIGYEGKDGWTEVKVSTITNQVWSTGRLRYAPDEEDELSQRISQYNRSIYSENIKVLQTAHAKHIADAGADMLLQIMVEHKLNDTNENPDEIAIGFYGGKTPSDLMRFLAQKFSRMEKREYLRYPRTVRFLSLVGSFAIPKIEVDPNAYFIYFPVAMPDEHPHFKFEFSALPVSGLVTQDEYKKVIDFTIVRQALGQRQSVDVIVGACGHWGPGHHSTYDYVLDACGSELQKLWEETVAQMEAARVIGDFCWCPLSSSPLGPISMEETRLRLFRAFSFDELRRFVHPELNRGEVPCGKLLLLVSPCYGVDCSDRSKGKILESILHAGDEPPVTHIVADSASAREYCQMAENSNRKKELSLAEILKLVDGKQGKSAARGREAKKKKTQVDQ